MSELPDDLRYTQSHEWLRDNGDGTVTVGITDHAQEALGDLVYVELPKVGTKISVEEACGVVESVKSASDLYAPLAGEILEVNEALSDSPEQINADPYGEGWIYQMTPESGSDLEALMDAVSYQEFLDAGDG